MLIVSTCDVVYHIIYCVVCLLTDLTGSADGSVKMFEFSTPKPVSVLRQAGSGPGITQIRFTQQGNKVQE